MALFLALVLLLQSPAAPPRDAQPSEIAAGKGVLRGRVLDTSSAQPVKGAVVTVHSPRRPESPSTTTDAEGRWQIDGLPVGEYYVIANKTAYVTGAGTFDRSVELTESRLERSLDLKLARGSVLSGRIVDPEGEPIPAAQVMALRETGRQWDTVSNGASTDDRGEFRVFGLAPGEYVLAAQRQDRPPSHMASNGPRLTDVMTYFPGTVHLAEAQRFSLADSAEYSDLTFTLQTLPSITVRGRVVVSADRIRHGYGTLNAVGDPSEFMLGPPANMMIDPDGSFRLLGVTSGTYKLTIQVELANGGQEFGELDLSAGDEDISGLVLRTYGPTTLAGRIVVEPAGAARPDSLSVFAQPVGRMNRMGGTDATVKPDGTFEIEVFHSPVQLHQSGQLDGWMQSGVRLKGHDVRGGLAFELGKRVEGIEIALKRATSRLTGSVSGVVRQGDDDHEGTVIVFHKDDENREGIGMAASVPIRDGRFSVGPMGSGDYQVVAVRTFDPSMFGKPEVAELLRARGTNVMLGENETRTVHLTLVTDY